MMKRLGLAIVLAMLPTIGSARADEPRAIKDYRNQLVAICADWRNQTDKKIAELNQLDFHKGAEEFESATNEAIPVYRNRIQELTPKLLSLIAARSNSEKALAQANSDVIAKKADATQRVAKSLEEIKKYPDRLLM